MPPAPTLFTQFVVGATFVTLMTADGKVNLAVEIASAIHEKQVSAREIGAVYAARVEHHNPSLNAFVRTTPDASQQGAATVDRAIAAGVSPGPLAGVPCAIKDNLCTKGVRTTCASRMLEDWTPPYTATAVQKLLGSGCIFLGKTNLDEFGMGSSTEYSIFGPTRNPYDTDRTAGGSSGGSAAAVAAGLAVVALGSDTGGSVRQPAALCGLVGVKPTYGRVSRYGLTAYASSFDHVGCMARTVRDAVLTFRAIAGHDPRDGTSLHIGRDAGTNIKDGVARLRVGIVKELLGAGVASAVVSAVERAAVALSHAGAETAHVSMPALSSGLAAYYQIASAEASSNLARYDGVRYGLRVPGVSATDMIENTRSTGFGDEVKRRIMLGTYVLSSGYYDAYYERARRVRTLVCRDFATVYETCDVLLAPTYPTTAFCLGEKTADPTVMYAGDICTIPSNLAGHPAMSVPFGVDERGLPVGVQILAPALREDLMFRTALVLEDASPIVHGPKPGTYDVASPLMAI